MINTIANIQAHNNHAQSDFDNLHNSLSPKVGNPGLACFHIIYHVDMITTFDSLFFSVTCPDRKETCDSVYLVVNRFLLSVSETFSCIMYILLNQ